MLRSDESWRVRASGPRREIIDSLTGKAARTASTPPGVPGRGGRGGDRLPRTRTRSPAARSAHRQNRRGTGLAALRAASREHHTAHERREHLLGVEERSCHSPAPSTATVATGPSQRPRRARSTQRATRTTLAKRWAGVHERHCRTRSRSCGGCGRSGNSSRYGSIIARPRVARLVGPAPRWRLRSR